MVIKPSVVRSALKQKHQRLEGAEDLTPRERRGRTSCHSGGWGWWGTSHPGPGWRSPRFSTYVDHSSTLPGSARRLLVHSSLRDPRARPERGCCRKTAEFHGQSFTSQNQGQQCPGPMNLFSDTVVERRGIINGVGRLILDAGPEAQLQLGWAGPWSLFSFPSRGWLALGNHQDPNWQWEDI